MKASIVLMAATMLAAPVAQAQQPLIAFEVLEASPASPATLHRDDHVYLRIRYETNVPMWIRGEYRDHGARAAGARMSGAGLVDPGQGEMLVWVSFDGQAAVDGIDLSASASGRDGFARLHMDVDYHWDGQPSAFEPRASWVAPLLADEQVRQKKAFEEMEQRFGSAGSGGFGAVSAGIGSVVGLLVLAVVVAGFVWPIWGAVRWTGAWRIAAIVPLATAAVWALQDAYDLAVDRTSHNLLPLEFALGAAIAAPYMLVVWIVRRIRLKRT